jgi:hypothetical protein
MRRIALPIALALAACTTPPAQKPVHKASGAPLAAQASAAPATAAPTPTAEPSPLPSLGLVLEGLVKVDAASLLANNYAQPTATGVSLVGEYGAGLISDKGFGLVANNGSAIITNNGSTLTTKVKRGLLDAAGAHDLVPVQGIIVSAVSLYDGTVLAGPVATDEAGRYHLGFVAAPASNIRIVARVTKLEDQARFTYSTFVQPQPAAVETTDSTRAVAELLVRVLAGRLQHSLDDRLSGQAVTVSADGLAPTDDENTKRVVAQFNLAIANASLDLVKRIDEEDTGVHGAFSRNFAQRVLSFAKLGTPPYQDLLEVLELLRKFEAGLATPREKPLLDEIVEAASYYKTTGQIPALLASLGMPQDQADALYERMSKDTNAITVETGAIAAANNEAVLGPAVIKLLAGD